MGSFLSATCTDSSSKSGARSLQQGRRDATIDGMNQICRSPGTLTLATARRKAPHPKVKQPHQKQVAVADEGKHFVA